MIFTGGFIHIIDKIVRGTISSRCRNIYCTGNVYECNHNCQQNRLHEREFV
jgi:hypothetical protein